MRKLEIETLGMLISILVAALLLWVIVFMGIALNFSNKADTLMEKYYSVDSTVRNVHNKTIDATIENKFRLADSLYTECGRLQDQEINLLNQVIILQKQEHKYYSIAMFGLY